MNVESFSEKQILELQNEVKDGNLTRFQCIVKILQDNNVNDALIKAHPKFCYKCIKLLSSVSQKIPKDHVTNFIIACANNAIFKRLNTEENLGFDYTTDKKDKTLKVDSDLFTLRNEYLSEKYLHLVNSGPRSKDSLYHLDLKKYDYIVVDALKIYFYESVLSKKFDKANFKFLFQMIQLAKEIDEKPIINLCFDRLKKLIPLLNDEELEYVISSLPKAFDEKVQITLHFYMMEKYAQNNNFRIILPLGLITKDSKIEIHASDIKEVAELKILDGDKAIHKIFQLYCNVIHFFPEKEDNLGELLTSLLFVSQKIRNNFERVLITKYAGSQWESYQLDHKAIIEHLLNSWSHFSSIKEIKLFDVSLHVNKKFQEGFIAIIDRNDRTICYIDPSKFDESIDAIKQILG